jgi:hypothetical protein
LQEKAWLKIPNKKIKNKQSTITIRLCPRDETIMQQPNHFSSISLLFETGYLYNFANWEVDSIPSVQHIVHAISKSFDTTQNNIFLSIFFSLSFSFFTLNPFYILFFIVP